MAYQFWDGFDNYGNNYTMTAGYPWDVAPNSASTVSTADFRFTPPSPLPGGCLVNVNSGNALRKTLSGNIGTIIMGFGFKTLSFPGAGSSNIMEVCQLWDAGTEQCCLTLNSSGALQFMRGAAPGGTLIGASTPNGTITTNAWYGFAIQVTVAGSTGGMVQLYINGNPIGAIFSNGLNTSTTGNAYTNQVSIGGQVTSTPTTHYDDFYCFDTTGTFNNTMLGGDARILTKMPASAGTYTNWTPTGLGANWQNGAVQPPSTSDYNANNTATTKDSYTVQSAGLGVAPYAVTVRASLERDDAGPHTPSLFVRNGAVDGSGTVTPALASSYLWYDAPQQFDPATGLVWTAVGADNAQPGIIEG